MKNLTTIVLAAGSGSRMNSKNHKVLHKIIDKTLLEYVLESVEEINSNKTCVVVGHMAEEVKNSVDYKNNLIFVIQEEQNGTGHAVMMASEHIDDEDNVLVLFGDTPLIKGTMLKELVEVHNQNNNDISLATCILDDPSGYGRIKRKHGVVKKIVEHKDCNEEELKITEVNTGVMVFKGDVLKNALGFINNDNSQGEYYLPDTLEYVLKNAGKVNTVVFDDFKQFAGINTKVQLYNATKIMQERINSKHMLNGVIISGNSSYIGKDVIIGRDTIIMENNHITGKTQIGEDCEIGINNFIADCVMENSVQICNGNVLKSFGVKSNATIKNNNTVETSIIEENVVIGSNNIIKNTKIGTSTEVVSNSTLTDMSIGNDTEIINSVCLQSVVGDRVHMGPFAYIRPNCVIGDDTKVGDFVEMKNAIFGKGSKASHLTYVGDAEVGENVNFGCGTITVNYDGVSKHKTIIGDNVFIGSNSNLVAPVTLDDNSKIAAGTTVTKNVEEYDLAIGRVRQENKKGFVKKMEK